MSSQEVENILRAIQRLSDGDYVDLMFKAYDPNRPADANRRIMKKLGKRSHKTSVENPVQKMSGTPLEGTPAGHPSTSTGVSAWKTPLIYRGDLLTQKLFLDVEKVSLKPTAETQKHKMVAETIAIVNEDSELVFWCFVGYPENEVCQIFPNLTNLSRDKLRIGLPLNQIQNLVKQLRVDRQIVGYDVTGDFDSIGIEHGDYLDLSDYFTEEKPAVRAGCKPMLMKYALKDVAAHLFPDKIFQCGIHSALSDARMTRDIWKRYTELKQSEPSSTRYMKSIQRSPKTPFKFTRDDICTCKQGKKKCTKQTAYMYPPF